MNPKPPPLADPHSTHSLPVDKKARIAKARALALIMVGSLLLAVGVFFVLGLAFNVLLASPSRPSTFSSEDVPVAIILVAIPSVPGFLLVFFGVRRWKRR